MAIKHYRQLTVWQRAMDLAECCIILTRTFPKCELFAMAPQISKAAASVAANIAEGQARGQTKEFRYFLRIARGSLAELETHLLLCQRVGLVSSDQMAKIQVLADETGKMLNGLYNSLATVDRHV